MIRGNEMAIDLGLEVLAVTARGRCVTLEEIVAFIEAAREVVGGAVVPFRKQDLWFLEHRALTKLRRRARCKTVSQFRERLVEPVKEAA